MSEEILLAVEDLTVSYRLGRSEVRAVDEVAFELRRGEVLALVGESGSGKSTIAHAILGLLHGAAGIDGGAIRFEGLDLATASDRVLETIRGRRIGFVPQDPTVSLNPVKRVGEQVAEALRNHRVSNRAQALRRAVELLDEAGIPDAALRARQYPHQFSGGMRQRALIAAALACRPALIVADEPTSALDVIVQKQILDALAGQIAEHRTSVLLVTHDLGVAAERADRVIVLRAGRIVEQGPAAQLFREPREPYTRALLEAAPSTSVRWVRAVAPETVRRQEPLPPALIEASGLSKRYRLGRTRVIDALTDIDLTVRRGRTVAVVGESGSGKTTLSRVVAGWVAPSAGEIRFDGRPLQEWRRERAKDLRRRVQYVYQNPYTSLDPRYTVGRILAEPLEAFRIGDRADRGDRVVALLEAVLLSPALVERRPAELSGGQRQRVAIARALAAEPELLLLDEPVSALDVSVQAQILHLLRELQAERGLTYLFVTHDLAVAGEIADEVVVMRAGQVVEKGALAQIFDAPASEYTRRLLAAIPDPARSRSARPPFEELHHEERKVPSP
ncbi:ABC transporter ATP-binding protein [Microbacterium sp. 18062]|uniref:dipeptide ABC transporter ATP-binding protein n=1 Tax=Microbacterium sp. 18062 TaxID=2681410 RepID=UPI00135A5685|nr:ABC transporter ATP-binding protein [Microbacterium sp. 18062]